MKNKSLIALAFGGFGIGMTEFVMMGLLPDISTSLNITIPQAGHIISMYALGVVVGAPLIAAYSGRFAPKKILISLMAFFTLAHIISAFAPSYLTLMAARFVAGLPHGAFFGVGAVVASRLADEGKAAQAISVMFSGLAIANIVGVPLGTYLGHTFSWRIVMGLIAVIGVVTCLSIRSWLPILASTYSGSFKDDMRIFKRADTWFAIFITSIGTGGLFAWISYIAPLSTEVAGFAEASVSMVLVVAGIGMTVGNSVGGILADKFSPSKAIAGLFFVMTITLILVSLLASSKFFLLATTFTVGFIAFSVVAPIQILIIRATHGSEILGSSLGQACFNVGNALGAYLGGLPLVMGYNYTAPSVVGAGLALTGSALAVIMSVKNQRPVSSSAV